MSRASEGSSEGAPGTVGGGQSGRGSASETMGAPVLDPFPPRPWTPEGRFSAWLSRRETFVADLLHRLTRRWRPLASFIVVNFLHPDMGPSGAMMGLHSTIDVEGRSERLKRVSVIPMSELEAYVPQWTAGETVLVHVEDMAEPLRRRYYGTEMRWSLNVPVFAESAWVGLIGAGADEAGFGEDAVNSYRSAAEVLKREFDADHHWAVFADGLKTVKLADVWLPRFEEPVFKSE